MQIYAAIIIILFLLLLWFMINQNMGQECYTNSSIQPDPYVKLYERFNQKNLIFDFQPLLSDPGALHLRKMVKVDVKSIDLNLPLKGDNLDDARTIKIWNIYNGDNTASSESDFYNCYTEPDFARKANSAKYQLLIDMKAGTRIKLNFEIPIKKVFIYARF